jgi:hypothetical protein
MSWLWSAAQTEQRALLRILLIRNSAVSASAIVGEMLWRRQMTSNQPLDRAVTHRGRTVLAIDCALAGAQQSAVAGRSPNR